MHASISSPFAPPRVTLSVDGAVEGYASLFGEIDQARDMVMPGAFQKTLANRGLRRIPMLFQHDPAEPVGIWLELREDFRGLWARGRLIPDVARGRELLALVKAGAIELTLECAALWAVVVHEFWTGDVQTINALVNAMALLIAYWGFRFGVLGVYVSGRTREKLCEVTGREADSGAVGKLVKAITRRK